MPVHWVYEYTLAPRMDIAGIRFEPFDSEEHLDTVLRLVHSELSEPYNVFSYREFLSSRPCVSFLALDDSLKDDDNVSPLVVGVVIGRVETSSSGARTGYIGIVAVLKEYRRRRVGSALVRRAIQALAASGSLEITLETECSNTAALRFYERLGFIREQRFTSYYLNMSDAFRLKLYLNNNRAQ